jgi:hypothetical protein
MFPNSNSGVVPGAESIPGKFPLFGHCNARFAFTTVEAGFAQSLLPDELELAPQSYAPAGFHPLLLMFNDTYLQSNDEMNRISKEFHLQMNLHYNEFIVMLPYVQFKSPVPGAEGPFCFLPVLYLDSILAVLGGRIFWEFNKHLARFDVTPTAFNVSSEITDSSLFSTTFLIEGDPVVDNDLANFNAITPILNLPVIEYGVYGYVSSIYSVAYQNVVITPLSLELVNHSCIYLPAGPISVPGIQSSPMGCFAMSYDWTLTYIRFIKN